MTRPKLLLACGLLAALATLAFACSDRVPLPSTATPSPSPAAPTPLGLDAATPSTGPGDLPDILKATGFVRLKAGAPLELPRDLALIIETGCTQCDGPTEGFVRVYRRPDGSIVKDGLFHPRSLGLGPRRVSTPKAVEEQEPYITGFALADDASEMIVSVCVQETCGSGGLDAWSPNSRTILMRSTDGGVTWKNFGELTIGGFVVALLAPSEVLIGTWEGENSPAAFVRFPSLKPVPRPNAGSWPAGLIDGDVVWSTVDGPLLRSDGSVFLDLGPNAAAYRVHDLAGVPGGFAHWDWAGRRYISFIGGLSRTYELPGFALAAVSIQAGTLIGDAEPRLLGRPLPTSFFGGVPAVFDLDAATVRLMGDLVPGGHLSSGRNHVVAVQQGPFARVAGTGSCLNVRAQPSLGAPVLDCASDGVLLQDLLELRFVEDTTWIRVRTPAGVAGWASVQYLEAGPRS